MIECVKIERAAATWNIYGNIISLPYRNDMGVDTTKAVIKEYISALKTGAYETDNYVLCNTFTKLGGIAFVKIGYVTDKENFVLMFRHYTEKFIDKWFLNNKRIHSKNVGIGHVFEEMLSNKMFNINYNFMYILDDKLIDSTMFVNLVNEIFIEKCTVVLTNIMETGKPILPIAIKIGLIKVYKCFLNIWDLTEKYIKGEASKFTEQREIITMRKLQHKLFGRAMDYREYSNLWELLKSIVSAEYDLQCKKFIRENIKHLDLKKDVWIFYQLRGVSLIYNKSDFSTINKPFLKIEIKSYIRYRFISNPNINDSAFSDILKCIEILLNNNPNIEYMADIDTVDIGRLYESLESVDTIKNGRKKSPLNTMNIFYQMRDFVRYLMGENRDKVLKTPRPQQNIFENYSFVNSDSFRNNTKIIPEFVVESLKKYCVELPKPYDLLFKIYIHTGLRAKEIALLEYDCVEPSKYENTVQLKYRIYKTMVAYRKSGLSEYRRLPISAELGKEILLQISNTKEYREKTNLPYIFLKNGKSRIVIADTGYLSVLVNNLISKHNICDENGDLWHFTIRQCRKTIAVTLIENGASVDEVGYWLGHLGKNNTMKYYAEVRQNKISELNTRFFRQKFDLLISREQLTQFSEEERKLLYVDFCMEQRRVELGFCLQKVADGGCTNRNSLYNCVNCKNLCTGKKYLPYWRELLEEQSVIVERLLAIYDSEGVTDYTEYKEYKQEVFLKNCYENIVNTIETAEGIE